MVIMEAWVRQLFADTEDFGTLTTKKVRLIYESETKKVLNTEEKRQLKQIIVRILPDFLSSPSPKKSSDEDRITRESSGQEPSKQDSRGSKSKNSSLEHKVTKRTMSENVMKEQDGDDDDVSRQEDDDEVIGQGIDTDEEKANICDSGISKQKSKGVANKAAKKPMSKIVVKAKDADDEGKVEDDEEEVNEQNEDDDNEEYNPLSSEDEESAGDRSPEKESEQLSTDASIVTSWKLKEAKRTKSYADIKRSKRRVSVGEVMEKMNQKPKGLKPCSVRLYDILSESGSGSSGELSQRKGGRLMSVGVWRAKTKRERLSSSSSDSGSAEAHRGSSSKPKQKARKIRKGSSSHSSDEDNRMLEAKRKESESDNSDDNDDIFQVNCRVSSQQKRRKEPSKENESDSDVIFQGKVTDSSQKKGRKELAKKEDRDSEDFLQGKGINSSHKKERKEQGSASETDGEETAVETRHNIKNCSVLLETTRATRKTTCSKIKASRKRKTIDSDSEESMSDFEGFPKKRQRSSNVNQRTGTNRRGSSSKSESSKKHSVSKKSNLSTVVIDSDESDFDIAKSPVADTRKRSQATRKQISLHSDKSDPHRKDSSEDGYPHGKDSSDECDLAHHKDSSDKSDIRQKVSLRSFDKRLQSNQIDSPDHTSSSSPVKKSGSKNKHNSKRSVTGQRHQQTSDSVESSSGGELEELGFRSCGSKQKSRGVLQSEDDSPGKSEDEPVSKSGMTGSTAVNVESDLDSDCSDFVTEKRVKHSKKGSVKVSSLRGKHEVCVSSGKRRQNMKRRGSVESGDSGSDTLPPGNESLSNIDSDSDSDSEREKGTEMMHGSTEKRKSPKGMEKKGSPLKHHSEVDVGSEKRLEEFNISPCFVSLVDILNEKSFIRLSRTTFLIGHVAESHKTGNIKALPPKLYSSGEDTEGYIVESSNSGIPCSKARSPTKQKTVKQVRKSPRSLHVASVESESDSDLEWECVSERRSRRSGNSGSTQQRDMSESDSDFEPSHCEKYAVGNRRRVKKKIKSSSDTSGCNSIDADSEETDSLCHSVSLKGRRKIGADDKGVHKRDQRTRSQKHQENSSCNQTSRSSRKSSNRKQLICDAKHGSVSVSHAKVIQSSDEGSRLIVETPKSPSKTISEKHKGNVSESEGSDVFSSRPVQSVNGKKIRGSGTLERSSAKKISQPKLVSRGGNKNEGNCELNFSDRLLDISGVSDSSDSKQVSCRKKVQKKLYRCEESDPEISALVTEISAKHLSPKNSECGKEESKQNLRSPSEPSRFHEVKILTDSDEASSSSDLEGSSSKKRTPQRRTKKQAENKLKEMIQMQVSPEPGENVSETEEEPLLKRRMSSNFDSESGSSEGEQGSRNKAQGKNRRTNRHSHTDSLSSVEAIGAQSSVSKKNKAVDEGLQESGSDIDDTSRSHRSSWSPQKGNLSKQMDRSLQTRSRRTEKGIAPAHDKRYSKKTARMGRSDDDYDAQSEQEDEPESGDAGSDSDNQAANKTSSPSSSSPPGNDRVHLSSESRSAGTDNSDSSEIEGPARRTSLKNTTPVKCILVPLEEHVQKEKSCKAEDSDVDTSSLSESELQSMITKEPPAKVLKKKKKAVSLKSVNSSSEKTKQSKKPKSKKAASKQKDTKAAPDKYSQRLSELVTICRAMGVFYGHRVRGCTSAQEKSERIEDYLETCGMKGEKTLAKARRLRLEREAAELSEDNILPAQEGRTRRRNDSFSSRGNSPRKRASPVRNFEGLRDIIDSEGSSD